MSNIAAGLATLGALAYAAATSAAVVTTVAVATSPIVGETRHVPRQRASE